MVAGKILYALTVKFDMMRVRENGWVVPRHNSGMLRAVRGVLLVYEERFPDLNRHARVAKFKTDHGDVLTLVDAMLMHASAERLVLSGFERDAKDIRTVDYAQTWVLVECSGPEATPTMGPAFDR